MNLPNFIVIGAAKSGTTSLYRYLEQHPSIYVSPIKETNFFATNYIDGEPTPEELDFCITEKNQRRLLKITTLEAYKQLFTQIEPDIKAIGEVSPLYMNSFVAAEKIKSNIKDVKIIAILRNPIDRAYSGYQMQLRSGKVNQDFASNLSPEEVYIRTGFYYQQLKRYFDVFDRAQIKVVLFEELKQDSIKTMQKIYKFIGVDDTFAPDTSKRFNQGGIPKNKKLYSLLFQSKISIESRKKLNSFIPSKVRRKLKDTMNSNLLSKPQALTPEEREKLKTIYREDILKLEKLIDKDLQLWLN